MWRKILAIGLALAVGCFAGATAEEKAERPKLETLTLELGDGVTLELVQIPAGKFLMGSPAEGEEADFVKQLKEDWVRGDSVYDETQHEVTISKPFFMGIHQVTQAQYEAVMGENPSYFKGKEDSANRPVEMVSWNDAMDFCKKLSEKTGRNVRLPTEAEWEYACRAGTTTMFNTGDTITDEQAQIDKWWSGKGEMEGTKPVGSFPANVWGLYDMHGNVWEWVADWFGVYPTGSVTDPQGPAEGQFRVKRGGTWRLNPQFCRSARRDGLVPGGWDGSGLGFRVSLD